MRCDKCDIRFSCNNVKIDGEGNPDADIMFVKGAPSKIDDEWAFINCGDTSVKLDYFLRKSKIKKLDCYFTSIVKCYKPSEPNRKEIDTCIEYFNEEVIRVKPKIIITICPIAQMTLIGHKGNDYRGYFFDYKAQVGDESFQTTVIPTMNVASSLNSWTHDDYILHDIKKARLFLSTGVRPKQYKPEIFFVDSVEKIQEAVDLCLNTKFLTIDCETSSKHFFNGELLNIGFSPTNDLSVIFPYFIYTDEMMKAWPENSVKIAKEVGEFVKSHRKELSDAIKKICLSDSKKGGHGLKFDVKFMRKQGWEVKNYLHDSILYHALIDENKKHNLSFLLEWYGIIQEFYEAELYLYIGVEKKKPYYHIPIDILNKYLAYDTTGSRRLMFKLVDEIRDLGLFKLYRRNLNISKEVTNIEYIGAKVDIQKINNYATKLETRTKFLKTRLCRFTDNEKFNPNSTKQIREFLSKHKFNPDTYNIKKTKTGYSLDEESLKKISKQTTAFRAFCEAILEFRKINKLRSTYLLGAGSTGTGISHLIDNDSGSFYDAFNLHSPRTGRMSAEKLQVIPKESDVLKGINLRSIFIPRYKDWCIWEADFAQLEMRVAALLAGDSVMEAELAENVDMHSRNIIRFNKDLNLFDKRITEKKFIEIRNFRAPKNYDSLGQDQKDKIDKILKKSSEFNKFRNMSKTTGFGLLYGKGPGSIASDFGISYEQAETMIDSFLDKYFKIAQWLEKMCDLVQTKGVITFPFSGRKRRFYSFANFLNSAYGAKIEYENYYIFEETKKQAMNSPIQGTAHDIYSRSFLDLVSALRNSRMDSRIFNLQHDAFIGEGPISEMKDLEKLINDVCTQELEYNGVSIKFPLDFQVWDSWCGNYIEY